MMHVIDLIWDKLKPCTALYLSLLIGCSNPYCIEISKVPESGIIKLKPGAEGKDTVTGLYINRKFGDSPFLTGYYVHQGSQVYIDNGFLDFDLSSIPPNAIIKEATLKLFLDTTVMNFDKIPMEEKINPKKWAIQPIIEPWNEDSVDSDEEPLTAGQFQIDLPPHNADYTCEINVTAMVKNQYLRPNLFFGFLIFIKSSTLILEPESKMKNLRYCSSDYSNAGWHPELIVRYVTSPN
ncbi:MAG: DNRLRE domain-containing protein [Sporocytophaga sp.]|nr:DNRLRE domain-containing protein [Sporocytophaga sp.]